MRWTVAAAGVGHSQSDPQKKAPMVPLAHARTDPEAVVIHFTDAPAVKVINTGNSSKVSSVSMQPRRCHDAPALTMHRVRWV